MADTLLEAQLQHQVSFAIPACFTRFFDGNSDGMMVNAFTSPPPSQTKHLKLTRGPLGFAVCRPQIHQNLLLRELEHLSDRFVGWSPFISKRGEFIDWINDVADKFQLR